MKYENICDLLYTFFLFISNTFIKFNYRLKKALEIRNSYGTNQAKIRFQI